jgi:hypothetical protein
MATNQLTFLIFLAKVRRFVIKPAYPFVATHTKHIRNDVHSRTVKTNAQSAYGQRHNWLCT